MDSPSEPSHAAHRSSQGRYTLFTFRDTQLRLIGPAPPEHYIEVTDWDRGYIVVQLEYAISDESMEEYIDLIPILEDLYMDQDEFCDAIESVEVSYV